MKIITDDQIAAIGITPRQCLEWVEKSLRSKPDADMPPKISVHPMEDSFFTAMPCYHPEIGRVGVKVISRVPGIKPSLKSKMMLFDANTGDMLALIDANLITAMRTGAVAALAAKTFVNDFDTASFGFVGLGVMGQATLKCLLPLCRCSQEIWLMRYKDQAEKVQAIFPDKNFRVADDRRELVKHTNLLFSCVTVMHDQFLPESFYPKGYTLVPVHVRGFQDCDLTFDKVFGDDAGHMRNWKNFGRYRQFAEFSDVILGRTVGRATSEERIICYNYGLALHDLWFASRIFDALESAH